jgi:putative transposase
LKYAFINQLSADYSVRRLYLPLKVHASGYYAWLAEPNSARAKDDQRLLGLIKHSWLESGGVYGYRKIHDDLREPGAQCGRHRAARLMRQEGLRSQQGIGADQAIWWQASSGFTKPSGTSTQCHQTQQALGH